MSKQRNLFFGKDSRSTPKKDGENPLVPDRRFRAPPPRSFEIRFTGRTVTQFGGYPLWHRFCHAVGLNQRFARHVRMNRGPLAFTAPELARFLTDAKVLGAQRPIARRDAVVLARNLSIFFRLWSAPTTVNRWTLATFQTRILRICGNLRRYKDRWILSLPTWWPYRTIIKDMIERCEARAPI